jgi:hypothetical protein
MRQLLVAATVAVAVVVAAGPASATEPFAPQLSSRDIQSPVEQQTPLTCTPYPTCIPHDQWVINPNGCIWDVDDQRDWLDTDGYLAARASSQTNDCLIADWAGPDWWPRHGLYVTLRTPSPDLVVRLSYTPCPSNQLGCLPKTVQPVPDGRGYLYQGCIDAPTYYSTDSALLPINGSQHGVGVYTSASVTVTNPTRRTIRQVTATIHHGAQQHYTTTGCA